MTGHDEKALAERHVALIDLLDRLLNGGVVLTGDLVLSIADIDLVRISLRAVVLAVREDARWALPALATEVGREEALPPGHAQGEVLAPGLGRGEPLAPGVGRGEEEIGGKEGPDGDRTD